MNFSKVILAISAGLLVLPFSACNSQDQGQAVFIQGQVEARQVNVASKIPGRLDTIMVQEGQQVTKGEPIARLFSPELEAKKQQTQGLIEAAEAQNRKALNGARQEEILGAKNLWLRAQQAEVLAEKTFQRVQNLFDQGVLPAQKRDEAEANYKASVAAATAAKSQYQMAVKGARSEDKAAAAGLLRQAKAGQAEVQSYLDETTLNAPLNGEVGIRLAEAGEIIAAGLPILTITDLDDIWVEFQVREDQLKNFAKGKEIVAQIPALDQSSKFKISYLSPNADYATWRSVKEAGGFDLKTFRVRARPIQKIPGLRPGMSVQIKE